MPTPRPFAGGQFSDTVSEAGTQLSLLHYAVKYGSLEVVSVLLAAGHRTDLRDKAGNRPVDWCFRAAIANLLDPSLDVQEVVPMVQRLEPRGDRALKVLCRGGDLEGASPCQLGLTTSSDSTVLRYCTCSFRRDSS